MTIEVRMLEKTRCEVGHIDLDHSIIPVGVKDPCMLERTI